MIRHDYAQDSLAEFAHLLTDCRIAVNELDGTELLAMYTEAGFLYEQKRKMLGSNLSSSGPTGTGRCAALTTCFTLIGCSDHRGAWAAITLWRAAERTHVMTSFRPEHPVATDFAQRVTEDQDNTTVVTLDYCPYPPGGETRVRRDRRRADERQADR